MCLFCFCWPLRAVTPEVSAPCQSFLAKTDQLRQTSVQTDGYVSGRQLSVYPMCGHHGWAAHAGRWQHAGLTMYMNNISRVIIRHLPAPCSHSRSSPTGLFPVCPYFCMSRYIFCFCCSFCFHPSCHHFFHQSIAVCHVPLGC